MATTDQTAVTAPPARKTFNIQGVERELFISYPRISFLANLVSESGNSLDGLADAILNPQTSMMLLGEVLMDQGKHITGMEQAEALADTVSAEEGVRILAWVEEHILNFILVRAEKTITAVGQIQAHVAQWMPS